MQSRLKMQREPKHARQDHNPLLCALPMSRPPVRGAGREGWQTIVLALREMPGEVRITHTHAHTHRLSECMRVETTNQHSEKVSYCYVMRNHSVCEIYSCLFPVRPSLHLVLALSLCLDCAFCFCPSGQFLSTVPSVPGSQCKGGPSIGGLPNTCT